jgi:hypothetical protein
MLNNYFEKMAKKKDTSKKHTVEKINLDFAYMPANKIILFVYVFIAILAAGLAYFYLNFAFSKNNYNGFPLDDPWIHLTFARNLIDYHSFSYFKNEIVTAGSTSPAYTIILAAGYLITKNEMILSYILGIIFFVFSAILFYKLSSFEFLKENIYALLITGIFIVDKWMNFISVSGMETTMYIFILIACANHYKRRKAVPFAVFLGLILWGRPDGDACFCEHEAD